MSTPRVSLEEQEKILLVAMGYLKEEESWTAGKWKCPATDARRKQKRDDNGNPLYQYCIEGAVNQATHDVMGAERAEALGAISVNPSGVITWSGNEDVSFTPTQLLGLDAISEKLYGEAAMDYNDSDAASHEGVLNILRTRLTAVQKRLRSKSA